MPRRRARRMATRCSWVATARSRSTRACMRSCLTIRRRTSRRSRASPRSPTRSRLAPDMPTLAELGYPIDIDSWYGLVAPAGTPKEVGAKLNAETLRILNLPELRERTRSQGIELAASTPEQFSAFLKADIAK